MSPSCQHVFFAIIVQNIMKWGLCAFKCYLVVFSLVKRYRWTQKRCKICHFILYTNIRLETWNRAALMRIGAWNWRPNWPWWRVWIWGAWNWRPNWPWWRVWIWGAWNWRPNWPWWRAGSLKLTSKLCIRHESPSYATADARLHFFAAKWLSAIVPDTES